MDELRNETIQMLKEQKSENKSAESELVDLIDKLGKRCDDLQSQINTQNKQQREREKLMVEKGQESLLSSTDFDFEISETAH